MSRCGKRMAWGIAGSAAAGVVLTVAVAWSVASVENWHALVPISPIRPPAWIGHVPDHWPTAPNSADFLRTTAGTNWEAKAVRRTTTGEMEVYLQWVAHYGVPFRSMGWQRRLSDDGLWTSGLDLKGRLARPGVANTLPMTLLWPGFALNTAFYGGIIFVLWSAPGYVRRRSRGRRGLCVACGYDLKGASGGVCPECGAAGPG